MDDKEKNTLNLLDFCKAFDKVPHRWPLSKLKYYGITDDLTDYKYNTRKSCF